ncbi:MAG TPA: methyltransferase domain-containing protein [Kofleriaceae bacterium]|nr:methyltransferase domain-containing protein [Kofleriaceae bacterium]
MDWRVKGTIQKLLGRVPGGARMHLLMQRRGGGLADFGRECDIKVDDWRLMMGHLRAAGVALAGATLLEMGTGWYPTFPFCLYLAGAARVYTLDLVRHLDGVFVEQLADRLAAHVPLIAREAERLEADVASQQLALVDALARGASVAAATGGVVDYHAPADAAATALPDESVDVVFSNSVLEHVPGDVIEACLAEAMRILRPGGIVFHSVNCGDHYAYADRSINQLHYLQYSDAAWSKWNNAFLYQNRLRARDFTEMARRAGFAIEIDTSRPSKERLAQLAQIRVHERFAHYPREQLAITSIDFVGRKPA